MLSSYNSPTSVPRAEITGTHRERRVHFSTGVTRLSFDLLCSKKERKKDPPFR